MENYLYKGYHTIYGSEEVLVHKQTEQNGDIIEIRIYNVPISEKNKEGISYSLVYVRGTERIVGFDNFEGHEKEGMRHHQHKGNKIILYQFTDIWSLVNDFNREVEKIKKGEYNESQKHENNN